MPYTTDFLEDKKIVIIRNIGKMSYKEYEMQTQEALEAGRKINTSLYLVDNTQVISMTSALELIDFPDMYERLGVPKTNKVAVLMPLDLNAQKNTKFFETICFNRGYLVRIFETKDEAIDWLVN